ncbi:putative RNA-binding Zn ribbon-like protein [Crossiella equi]|uniref:RNA-binding Zn ribbon-like protein n=1 Tax=Crossiella equi TaxID=130796 RepID=A0ABS5A7X5_9PSEU|nr:CGNR zinc finger domain-containing protein [Crossiella equi]MBP2472352.1 putative RNA-binding Zn ribbon-like protein [Crossiella equi]
MVQAVDEALVLALLNTTPVVDGVPTDQLADAEGARTWLQALGWPVQGNSARALREVREALKAVVRGEEGAGSLMVFLREVQATPDLANGEVRWLMDSDSARSVAVHVVMAWAQFESRYPGRMRPCANPDCARFLVDRSKANNARWCSMALCGNRMKARRHYQRSREN